jgi:hypothetical protein
MTLTGTIKNGVVVFDHVPAVDDGTRVTVVLPTTSSTAVNPTLANLLDLAGSVKGLPSDFAEQHDHYLHGTPKK